MPVFQYEIADRKGAVSRGTAEAPEQAELINRFRERGQVVLSLRETAGARTAVDGIGMQSVAEGFRESVNLVFIRLLRDVVDYHVHGAGAGNGNASEPEAGERSRYLEQSATRESLTPLPSRELRAEGCALRALGSGSSLLMRCARLCGELLFRGG